MKYKKILQMLLLTISMVLFISQTVSADIGPKPSITVYVKNYKTQTYYLDLLTKGVENEYDYDYTSFENRDKYPDDIKNMPFYKYNEGGWMATHIRYRLLFGDIKGKYDEKTKLMVHRFSYFGVPDTFKIIAQDDKGDLIVSNVITPKQFNAEVYFDLQTGRVTKVPKLDYGLSYFLFLIVLTVMVELLLARLFKYRRYKLVIMVNVLTQIFMHFILAYTFKTMNYRIWYMEFLLLEVLVFFTEFIVYLKLSREYTWKRILMYTLSANVVTFVLGLFLDVGI